MITHGFGKDDLYYPLDKDPVRNAYDGDQFSDCCGACIGYRYEWKGFNIDVVDVVVKPHYVTEMHFLPQDGHIPLFIYGLTDGSDLVNTYDDDDDYDETW